MFVFVAFMHDMHSFPSFQPFSKELKVRIANIAGNMDFGRRSVKKYNLINPKIDELKKLVSSIADPIGFRDRYGALISLLTLRMEEGLLQTLVQFYDPVYHCFTFPDSQLMPTLEEYAQLLHIPVADTVPFSGSEKLPEHSSLAKVLYMKKSEFKNNFTTKGGLPGFTAKFLMGKVSYFASQGCDIIVEHLFALLIYGLLLFPNIEGFVDSYAIRIFLSGNPVPTLLGDTYHSIHYRTLKGGGTIVCCIPLLYKWFVSHLPKSATFWDRKSGLQWSQRIMSLTQSDIAWYSRVLDDVKIIDSCGEFPNVPLMGTKGIISYNPVLARRQLGYPMKDKPPNILLEGIFLRDNEEDPTMKERVVRAWHRVCRKGRLELGKKDCTSYEPYLQWIRARAIQLKMPYPHHDPIKPAPLKTPYLPLDDKEELQATLERVKKERDAWKDKAQVLEMENEELQRQLKEQSGEDRAGKRPRVQEDLFSSGTTDYSQIPQSSGAWKGLVDSLVKEKAFMQKAYEERIERLEGQLLLVYARPDDTCP